MTHDAVTHFFEADGELSQAIEGYQPRETQITMANAVADSIQKGETLVVEAGTGTGKTFAYLVPALLSDATVFVSTGTKHLQDQLFEKDIPLIRSLIKKPITAALLKGRSNYICLYRMKTLRQRGRFENKKQVDQFYKIERYANQDNDGDLTQLSGIDDPSLWGQVTSTTDNCLHSECPDYEECFLFRARKEAKEADIVVINHHLLCADLALKQEGFGEILPQADVIIIDEAHQLADTAGLFFSTQLGTKQLFDWIEDLNKAIAMEAKDFANHDSTADLIHAKVADLRRALPPNNQRFALADFEQNEIIQSLFQDIAELLETMRQLVEPLKVRAQIFPKMIERLEEMQQRWNALVIEQSKEDNNIRWLETYTYHIALHSTPLDIADHFRQNSNLLNATWIYTSATLAVNDNFNYFCAPLGLSTENTLQLESPFDFPRISLLYHPPNLPAPNDEHFLPKMLDAIEPVIDAAKGRTFILFTSYYALNEAYKLLQNRTSYPLFKQGDLPKMALIDAFRQSGNGILLGTMSFWEGVDVKGDSLACVVIEKFPFASPGDPIEQAKIDLLKRQNRNPFIHYQLPKAIITLKQGVGRLIRDPNDYGVLVLADSRLSQKSYGRQFLESLPPMTRTLKAERVQRFFDYINESRQTNPT